MNVWLYHFLHYDKAVIHKIAGVGLQIVGGAFVLFSLNKNMGVFKQGTLLQRVVRWIRSFPLIKRTVTLQVQSIASSAAVGTPTIRAVQKGRSVEERIEELERRIAECFQEVSKTEERLRKRIESVKAELKSELSEKAKSIAEIESRLVATVVGSANSQVFGILLVFYGTILPLW
jgi:hypothetical protein